MTFLPGYDTTGLGLSPAVWKNVRPDVIAVSPIGFFKIKSDWTDWQDVTPTTAATTTPSAANNWTTLTNKTTNDGQMIKASSIAGAPGDIISLDSEGGADQEGVEVQFLNEALTPRDGYDIHFEARWALTDIGTPPDTFVGLASSDATILAGTTPSATDFTGFYTNASTSLLFGNDVDVTATSLATLTDHATGGATSFVKTGFILKETQDGGSYVLNGVPQIEEITWAGAANAVMYPSFACSATAAVDSIMYLHWYAIAQVPTAN